MKKINNKDMRHSKLKSGFLKYIPLAGIAMLIFIFVSCDGVLDVDNPNSLVEEDINNPAAAEGLANGALATTMRGIGYIHAANATVTDEVRWTGSRDNWRDLSLGRVADFNNEFIDWSWPFITEARWTSDLAINQLNQLRSEGTLPRESDLARAYLYSSLIRTVIAEVHEDFVYSDRREPGTPFGSNNMDQMFAEAINNLGEALTIAQNVDGSAGIELQRKILGLRARVYHARAVRASLSPRGSSPANPLINDAAARADALAGLDLMSEDYKWILDFSSAQVNNQFSSEVVSRGELTILESFDDPITNEQDPRMEEIRADFYDASSYGETHAPITVISAREMHLIIAEADLANSPEDARTRLNMLRSLNNLPPIEAGDNLLEMLIHERRANLFVQGKRLNDLYRFDIKAPEWETSSSAYVETGLLFPIPIQERRANPNIGI